jgi:hypothetical protein
MATFEQFRAMALSFPGVSEELGKQIAFSVKVRGKMKGIAWEWMERVDPRKPRVVNPGVYAIRTRNVAIKDWLVQQDGGEGKVFTEPHYQSYPAVLVVLDRMEIEELRELFEEGYRCFVPSDS